jgi:acyl-CoA thioesterase-1
MRFRLVLTICVLAAHVAVPAQSAEQTIVVVGDSLSSGYGLASEPSWVTLLADRLDSQGYGYEVVNASISGDTTAGGLARLPRLLEAHDPAIVVIELGGNDGLRGQSLAAMRNNLSEMIGLAQHAGSDVLLAGIQIPPNYGATYTQDFAGVYPELADEYQIPLVGFFMDGVALTEEFMQRDRVHPNAAGQSILLDNVWPVLIELLDR